MRFFYSRTIIFTVLATFFLVFSSLGISAQAASDASHLKKILDRGEIRIGVLDGFKPWAFRGPDGSMKGIAIDLAQDIADTLEVKLKPVVVTSANRIEFLRQGRIDVIIGGMYDTAARRKEVDMIEPGYWASGPSLMAKKGLISSWEDLKGKPVCVKQGVDYNFLLAKRFGAELVSFPGNTEAKQGLQMGKCVAWAYEDSSISMALASGDWDGYEMPVDALYTNPWAAAVPRGEGNGPLAVLLTGEIYRWHSSGKFIELAKKWHLQPTSWLVQMHENLKWDTSYLDRD